MPQTTKKANEIGNGRIIDEYVSQAMYAVMKGLTRQRVNALRQTDRLDMRRYFGRVQVRDRIDEQRTP